MSTNYSLIGDIISISFYGYLKSEFLTQSFIKFRLFDSLFPKTNCFLFNELSHMIFLPSLSD